MELGVTSPDTGLSVGETLRLRAVISGKIPADKIHLLDRLSFAKARTFLSPPLSPFSPILSIFRFEFRQVLFSLSEILFLLLTT